MERRGKLDTGLAASLCLRAAEMKRRSIPRAVLTDSHFLIPLAVFCLGVVLLIAMH